MRSHALTLSTLLLAACGSSSSPATVSDAGDGGADAGDGGADAAALGASDAAPDAPAGDLGSACQSTMCWRVVPRLSNPEEGETETFVSDECRCADGWACTGTQTVSTGVATRTGLGGYHDPAVGDENIPTGRATATYKVCQPTDRTNPAALVFDFRDDAPLLPVTLRFRRDGGAWPSSSTSGSAGELTITPERPQAPLTLQMPTSGDGTLQVMLPPGHHGVRLQMGRGPSFDSLTYPISTLEGELTVEQAGEAIIDVPATPFTFDVRLGGAAFPVPKQGESVAVRIEGRYGLPGISSNLFVWKRSAGQALVRRTVWLEPGKYTVTVITEGAPQNPSLPAGFVIATRYLEIGGAPLERTFDLQMVQLDGAITVDGKDLAPGATAEVDLAAKDAVARAVVAPTRPARYSVLAFAKSYDVSLATEPGIEGLPSGSIRVAQQKTITQSSTLPIDVTTTRWSAEVTLNGMPLPDAMRERGALALVGAAEHELALGKTGPARVSAPVYQGGPATVNVVGVAGGPLPPVATAVATGFTPSSAPVTLDVALAPVTIGLRVDGSDPPAGTTARGQFRFSRADDPTARFSVDASSSGPLTATLALPPGTWKAIFRAASDAAGVPVGELALPELVVPREGLTKTFEATSAPLAIELRHNGALLPDAAGVKDRGVAQVGATRVHLPRTGPSRLTLRAFPGITSLSLICDETCGTGLPPFVTVVPRVQVGP
jgi:hypothetical protein